MFKDRLLTVFTTILLLGGAGCIGFVVFSALNIQRTANRSGHLECIDKTVNATAVDPFMAGIINKDSAYSVLTKYYDCNPINRNDIVWFQFSRVIAPVPRRVVGLPDDNFDVVQDPSDLEKWFIKIGDDVVKSHSGQDYFIKSKSVPPLKTYALSLKGKIPKDKYIILSSEPPGLTDSSNLGLVRHDALVGRVQVEIKN